MHGQSTAPKQSDDQSTIRHLHGRSLHLYFLVRYSVIECAQSLSLLILHNNSVGILKVDLYISVLTGNNLNHSRTWLLVKKKHYCETAEQSKLIL